MTEKIPERLELLPYVGFYAEAAWKFGVSERTIRRWMQKLEIYDPKPNYGRGKLDDKKATQIRALYSQGHYTQTDLSEMFGVTQAMIGRVINNQAYPVDIRMGGIAETRIEED